MILVNQNGTFKEPSKMFYKVNGIWRTVNSIYESNVLHKLNLLDTTRIEYDKIANALSSKVKILKKETQEYLESETNPTQEQLETYVKNVKLLEVYEKYLDIIRLEQVIKTQIVFQNTAILEYNRKISNINKKLIQYISKFKDVNDIYRVIKISDNVPNQSILPKERLDVAIHTLLDSNGVSTDLIENRIFNIGGFSYRIYANYDYSSNEYKNSGTYKTYEDKILILNSIHERINTTEVDPENGYKILINDLSIKDFLKEINSLTLYGAKNSEYLLNTVSIQQKYIISQLSNIKNHIIFLNSKLNDPEYSNIIIKKDGYIIPELKNPYGSIIDRKVYPDKQIEDVIKKEFSLLKAFYSFLGIDPSINPENIITDDIIKEIDDYIKDNDKFPDDKTDYKDQYDKQKDKDDSIEEKKNVINEIKDNDIGSKIDEDKFDEAIEDIEENSKDEEFFDKDLGEDTIINDPTENPWKNTYSGSKTYKFKPNELVTVTGNAFVAIIQTMKSVTQNHQFLVYMNNDYDGQHSGTVSYIITVEGSEIQYIDNTFNGNIKLNSTLTNIINVSEVTPQDPYASGWGGSFSLSGVNDKIINVMETDGTIPLSNEWTTIDAPHPVINEYKESETYDLNIMNHFKIDCEVYTTPFKAYTVRWIQDQIKTKLDDQNDLFNLFKMDNIRGRDDDAVVSFKQSYTTEYKNINPISIERIKELTLVGLDNRENQKRYYTYSPSQDKINGYNIEDTLFYTFRSESQRGRDDDAIVSFKNNIIYEISKEDNSYNMFNFDNTLSKWSMYLNNGYSQKYISSEWNQIGLDSSGLSIFQMNDSEINNIDNINNNLNYQIYNYKNSNNGYSQKVSIKSNISDISSGLAIIDLDDNLFVSEESVRYYNYQLGKNNKMYIISTRLNGGIFDPNNPLENNDMNRILEEQTYQCSDKVNKTSSSTIRNLSAGLYRISDNPSYTKNTETLRMNVWLNNEAVNTLRK